jgi:phage terminase large subunit GpA-like protein
LEYPEDAPLDVVQREAHLLCPINGCIIADHERRAMNLAAYRSTFGGWIGIGQELSEGGMVTGELVQRDTAGFFIVGPMSTLFHGGIGALARARAKAQREYEADGDDKTLRQVMVKQWGHIYTAPKAVGSLEAKDLAGRAEHSLKRGIVPAGVRYLVLVIDCQIAHFEWLLRGFGVKGESWVIDTGRVAADPATKSDDWDKLLELMEKPWPLEGDASSEGKMGRGMKVRGVGFDSGGQAGVTLQAYLAWARWRKEKKARYLGKAQGRDVFTIMPMKGASTARAARLLVTYPDTARKANKRAGGGNVPTAFFNTNDFKDDLAGQLGKADQGPLYVHIPASFCSKEEPHVWFEQLTAEVRDKRGRWDKKVSTARNEALDLMVMSDVIAYLHGARRIDWDKPPSWADAWDKNSQIVAAETAQPAKASSSIEAQPGIKAKPKAKLQQQTIRKKGRSRYLSRH